MRMTTKNRLQTLPPGDWIILDCLLQVAAAQWCCQGDAVADMKNKWWEAATQLCSFADNADLCGSLHFGQVKSTHEYVALGGFQSQGGTPKSSNLDNFGIETHGFKGTLILKNFYNHIN